MDKTDEQWELEKINEPEKKHEISEDDDKDNKKNGIGEKVKKKVKRPIQRYEVGKHEPPMLESHYKDKAPNKVVLLSTIVWVTVLLGIGYSLKPPFYPELAKSKGVPPSVFGFVICTVDLGILLISLPAGNFMHALGTKKLLCLGTVLLGLSTLAFSSVASIENQKVFVAISIICRLVEAAGHFICYVSSISTLMTLYPESMGVMTSGIELSFGMGLIIGPLLGGLLIDAKNFTLPFALLGGFMLISVPLILYVIPQVKPQENEEEGSIPITTLFKIPKIWIGLATVSASYLMFGFQNATLEPHLEEFELSETVTGVLFSLAGFMYSTSTVIVGVLCDKGIAPIVFISCGLFFQVLGNALLGPLAWIPVDPQMPLIIPGLVISGIGIGGTIIPSMMYMRHVVSEKGYLGNVDINGMISSMFSCALATGATLGAFLGGIALQELGYRPAQFIFISYNSALLVFILFLTFCLKFVRAKKDRSAT